MDPQLSRGPSRGSPRRGGRTSGSCLRHAEDGGGAGSRYGEDSLNPKLHLATPGCECRAETFRVVRPPLDGISIAGGDRHRSEERRVGQEWVSLVRYRWSPPM